MRIPRTSFRLALIGALILPLAAAVAAAEPSISFRVPAASIAPSGTIAVPIFITSSVPLNAFAVTLRYPPELLSYVSYQARNSIVDVWKQEPTADGEGLIRFEGGAQKAFVGTDGELMTLFFETRATGIAKLSFEQAQFYRADCTGTRVAVSALPAAIRITSGGTAGTLPADSAPPVFSEVQLVSNPENGAYLITYTVADEGTGISEVLVRTKSFLFWSVRRIASHPVAVPPFVWSLELVASDGAGNKTTKGFHFYDALALNGILTLMFFAGVGIVWRRWRTRSAILKE